MEEFGYVPEMPTLFLFPFTVLSLSLALAHMLGVLKIPKSRGFLFFRKRSEGQKGAEVIVAKRGQVAVRS